jgi:hypothetical protein
MKSMWLEEVLRRLVQLMSSRHGLRDSGGRMAAFGEGGCGKESAVCIGQSLGRNRILYEMRKVAYLTFNASGTALGLKTCARMALRI